MQFNRYRSIQDLKRFVHFQEPGHTREGRDKMRGILGLDQRGRVVSAEISFQNSYESRDRDSHGVLRTWDHSRVHREMPEDMKRWVQRARDWIRTCPECVQARFDMPEGREKNPDADRKIDEWIR